MTILADAHTPRPAAARGPPPAGMAEDDGDEFAELERAETMDGVPDPLTAMDAFVDDAASSGPAGSRSGVDAYERDGGGGASGSGRGADVLDGAIVGSGSGGVVLRLVHVAGARHRGATPGARSAH